jgi:molybdopterin molybdotransferase
MRAPEMAILTVGGRADVLVSVQPRIAVISTGDELAEAGKPIGEFQIRSSNDRALEAALRSRNLSDIRRVMLRDDPDDLTRAIASAWESADVLILTGGVSMGAFDHVPRTLEALGVAMRFHKITQRPGLPMWFGVGTVGDNVKPVFALPGNPVSSLVCLVRYVAGALAAGLGARPQTLPRVKLAENLSFTADLTWFLPVRLAWNPQGETLAQPRPTNTSGDFVSLRDTDGFVELPRGGRHFPAGYAANFYSW